MSTEAIRAERLSKAYRIGLRDELHDTLVGAVRYWLASPVRNFRRLRRLNTFDFQGKSEDVIWALRDVSFDVPEGEVLGVIGRNGAGKSTLLKVLSRITEPTQGRAIIRGRVSSLLEVGTGFHPELTGRENVYMNGTILGMTKREIDRKFDRIVAFSGVEKFIETPIKRYSSGMKVRLAFSVAAYLEPDILLIDEVLAVGDAEFQAKCLGKMGEVAREGRTVVFVSHNMAAISRLCERAMWLDGGKVRLDGHAPEVIAEYLASGAVAEGSRVWEGGLSNPGEEDFKLDSICVRTEAGKVSPKVEAHQPITIELHYRVLRRLPVSRIGVLLSTPDGITVLDSYDSDHAEFAKPREPGRYTSRCTVPGRLLNPGRYFISVNAGIPRVRSLAHCEAALTLDVVSVGAVGSRLNARRTGVICPLLPWEQERRGEAALAS